MIADKLKKALHALLPDAMVQTLGDERELAAFVVTERFASMPEIQRQRYVWSELALHLSEREQRQIDFVFTFTPAKWREAQNTRAAS